MARRFKLSLKIKKENDEVVNVLMSYSKAIMEVEARNLEYGVLRNL